MSFKDIAIDASKQYYSYLKQTKKSLIKYKVSDIFYDDIYFYLQMNSKITSLDNLLVKINANIYYDEQFKIVSYDEENKVLQISANNEYKKLLLSATSKEVEIVVDLTFLIKNVQRFYEQYGNQLYFPHKINNVPMCTDNLKNKPSEEQLAVIQGALNTPMSYIWGAPGTGKTRFVLSDCILSYLKSKPDCKLLITAPTNNAVEQTLYGLLKVLKDNNIPEEKVFRLGTASSEFYTQYPTCCENRSIELLLKKAKDKLLDIDVEIFSIQIKLEQYEEYIGLKEVIKNKDNISKAFDELISILTVIENTYEKITELENEYYDSEDNIENLNKSKSALSQKIEQTNALILKYSTGIRKLFCSKKRNELSQIVSEYTEAINKLDTDISAAKQKTDKINEELDSLESYVAEKETRIMPYLNYINNIMHNDPCFKDRAFIGKVDNSEFYIKEKDYFEDDIISFAEERINSDEYAPFKDFDFNSYKGRLSNLLRERNEHLSYMSKISEQSSQVKLNECTIIAATLDTCIKRLSPKDFSPAHIFLDEAGYCPLIKAVPLLAYGSQLTLLGDHMQLPPICEMNDNDFKNENFFVALYAQSALHIEEIFDTPESIINNYLNNKEPQFNYLIKFELNHTFRFGEKLAEILANSVYSSNFKGSAEHKTNIYFIDCPKENHKERISPSEATQAVRYVVSHSYDDIGIITPYIKQRNLILNELNKKRLNTNVYTIHGSQGREWDTVLLSVVDTTNKWFTDSNKFIKVINTAVSRARNKLIIVCDYNYWQTQHKQLIGKIVSIAEPVVFLKVLKDLP